MNRCKSYFSVVSSLISENGTSALLVFCLMFSSLSLPTILMSAGSSEPLLHLRLGRPSAQQHCGPISLLDDTLTKRRGRPAGSKNVKARQRLDVEAHLNAMDHCLFRRKYRMGKAPFFKLYNILGPFMSSTGERDGVCVPMSQN